MLVHKEIHLILSEQEIFTVNPKIQIFPPSPLNFLNEILSIFDSQFNIILNTFDSGLEFSFLFLAIKHSLINLIDRKPKSNSIKKQLIKKLNPFIDSITLT